MSYFFLFPSDAVGIWVTDLLGIQMVEIFGVNWARRPSSFNWVILWKFNQFFLLKSDVHWAESTSQLSQCYFQIFNFGEFNQILSYWICQRCLLNLWFEVLESILTSDLIFNGQEQKSTIVFSVYSLEIELRLMLGFA